MMKLLIWNVNVCYKNFSFFDKLFIKVKVNIIKRISLEVIVEYFMFIKFILIIYFKKGLDLYMYIFKNYCKV